jgi:hypothetical protein
MDRSEVSLEDIDPVKAPFSNRTRQRAERADHGALEVGQDMSLLVILANETSAMIFAAQDRAFSWAWIVGRLRHPESLDEKLPAIKTIHITLRSECQ